MEILIVDDEPLALEILESYISKLPGLHLAGVCSNALEAFSILNNKKIDLMLLDINMPEINGMDFLRSLRNPPPVIFTTAYSEFAAVSYDVGAVDYLVKPIPFDRFIKAIDKARERNATTVPPVQDTIPILFVRTEGRLVKIDLNHLWMIEALKDYVRLWTENGKIVIHSTMKNMEEQLADRAPFLRINKSCIINMQYISEVDGNAIRIKDQSLTIGSTYRDAVFDELNRYKLL